MPERTSSAQGALLAVAGATLWGTTGTSQALLVGHHSPIAVGSLRAAIAGAALLVAALLRGRGPAPLREALRAGRWRWILLAGAGVGLYQLAFFAAVAATGVGVGTLIALGTAPTVAGLIGWALEGVRPSRTWVVSTVVALCGAALLVLGSGTAHHVDAMGLLLAVAAGACFATYSVASRQVAAQHVDGLAVTACVFVVAALLLVAPLAGQDLSFVTPTRNIAVLGWLGIIATAVAYLLYQSSMRHVTAATAATLALTEPMVANVLAVVVLHEPFTGVMALGVALVLGGMALLARA